jgi:hypothetical protein
MAREKCGGGHDMKTRHEMTRTCEGCGDGTNPVKGKVLRRSIIPTAENNDVSGFYHDSCFRTAVNMPPQFPSVPEPWTMMIAELADKAHQCGEHPEKNLGTDWETYRLTKAIAGLIAACPQDTPTQLAARKGGTVLNPDEVDSAMKAIRCAALIELLQEARKEKSSRSAYKRVLRALKMLGLTPGEATPVLFWLEYHDREGKPYAFLQAPPASRRQA